MGRRASGYTLIELLIMVSIVAIFLTLALPIYSNYTIRAKIGQALREAAAAKTAVNQTCLESPGSTAITADQAGYDFIASSYVSDISVSGSCVKPVITIQTQLTGATPDPVIVLTGYIEEDRMEFDCVIPDSLIHVPRECRS